MSWIIFITVLVVIIAVLVFDGSTATFSDGFFWFMLVIAVAWLMAGGVMLGMHLTRDYDRRECRSYSHQTERDVRFLQTGYWNWDCYVMTNDGWVPKGQIVKIEKEGQ